MKKIILSLLAIAMTAGAAFAIPAKRGFSTYSQTDGTSITVQCIGDEFNHSFVTTDGLTLAMDERGDYYYRTITGVSNVKAHNVGNRDANEMAFVEQQKQNLSLAALATQRVREKVKRNAAVQKATQVPTKGSPKVPILLVQYSDKKMSNAKSAFVNQFSQSSTSVKQYFIDQSNGQYTPQFEVFGIYTLSGTRATYGGNDSSGNDKGVALMVAEACELAQKEGLINWKDYDNDGDGECDVVIVMYAGVGEAQASRVPNAIWPCQWTLASGGYYGDGPGALNYNSTRIDKFAVFNEVNGSSDYGTTLDGIGTFCHEFSHCLGLPDFYETTYNYGYYGMGSWSLMDYGSYNNNGYTPIGYSAYEKNFMGWLDYVTPKSNTKYVLPVFNQKDANTDVAVKVTSPINANECYILEYRKRQGWDQYIAADGVLISHCSYIKSRWDANTVNNESVQLMTIIPADGSLSSASESTDLWGSSKHELTNSSSPKATLSLTASGSPSSNAGYMNQPLTEINLNSDGTASFWYMKDVIVVPDPVMDKADEASATNTSFKASWNLDAEPSLVKSYTLQVNKKSNAQLLETASFANLTAVTSGSSYTNQYNNRNKYLPSGWTCSTPLYIGNGCIIAGNTVTTKGYNVNGFSEMTVAITAKQFSSSYTPCTIKVSVGSNTSETFTLSSTEKTVKVVLPCSGGTSEKVVITASNYPCISNIEIYAGDASASLKAPSESGDENSRTITGITTNSYIVKNLLPGGEFTYKVKAILTNGDETNWSNTQYIKLPEITRLLGDVNKDGLVDVTDVTVLINHVLGIESTPFNSLNADIDENGTLDVTDATLLINMILNAQ
ncbi:MAG: M6 family metalloprotease domain-containing protein [Bacteroidales bacterium]|nr:M6 family metalloprotease domain-containing protein [Bacteroidales bacterium]